MKFLVLSLLLMSPVYAQVAPKKGEIRLEGVVAALDKSGKTFQLEVEAFTLPSGKTARLARPKAKTVRLDGTAIFPRGDANWKLPSAALRVGYGAFAIGADDKGAALQARSVELKREVEGRKIDYFVAQNGSDAGDGGPDSPWRSVQVAVRRVPAGFEDEPCVLHLGAGDFGESFDGQNAGLLIENQQNLILTGAGAKIEGGTQITTGSYAKTRSGVVRVAKAQNIAFRNLVIGDDKNWQGDAFFEATLHLEAGATVDLKAVRLVGPSEDTLFEGDKKRAPTAIHAGNGDAMTRDGACFARLENVLVTGHGSFLSNPAGQVWCDRVTIARTYGFSPDDVLLFLQTPHAEMAQRRYVFQNCVFYELRGHDSGRHLWFTAGEQGQDKVFFDSKNGGTNWVVRCNRMGQGSFYTDKNLAEAFPIRDKNGHVRAQGVWLGGDPEGETLGGLRVDNDLKLDNRAGWLLAAPDGFNSGWTGGLWSPANP